MTVLTTVVVEIAPWSVRTMLNDTVVMSKRRSLLIIVAGVRIDDCDEHHFMLDNEISTSRARRL